MPLGPAAHEREGYEALRRQNEGFIRYWQFWVFGIALLMLVPPLLISLVFHTSFEEAGKTWFGIGGIVIVLGVIWNAAVAEPRERRRRLEEYDAWVRANPEEAARRRSGTR